MSFFFSVGAAGAAPSPVALATAPARAGARVLFRQYAAEAEAAAAAAAPAAVMNPMKVIGYTACAATLVSGVYLAGERHTNLSKEECARMNIPHTAARENYDSEGDVVAHTLVQIQSAPQER